MAKVYYIQCPKCNKEYYIDNILWEREKDEIKTKCPYCKNAFTQKKNEETVK